MLMAFISHVEAIAHVAHGANDLLHIAEFGAQTTDVNIHGSRTTEVVITPDFAEQLLTCEDAGRVGCEEA